MDDLGQRKGQILRAVIVEYVSAAEPVASDLIARKYELGVRSATVRNELAEMSDLGYLEQPHTSAGRIPSDQGYRYYVDKLIVRRPVDQRAKDKVLHATEEQDTLRELLQETTKALSRITHLVSAAATVRDAGIAVRNVVVTALGPERALLVVVLGNGHVENRILECPVGLTLEHVGRVNEALSSLLSGKTVGSLTRIKAPVTGTGPVDQLLASCCTLLRSAARELTRGQLVTEGEEYILAQPEFQRSLEAMEVLLRSLEDEEAMHDALLAPTETPQTITIGRENRAEALQNLALLRHTFYIGDEEAGTLAIIGPTRMNYDSGITLLSFTAKAISETLSKLLR